VQNLRQPVAEKSTHLDNKASQISYNTDTGDIEHIRTCNERNVHIIILRYEPLIIDYSVNCEKMRENSRGSELDSL
jgi:hypothetical protein